MSTSFRFARHGLALLAVCAFPAAGFAFVVGFQGITNNDAQDVATGQQQLTMDVSSLGTDQAQFTFFNTGTDPCVITQIYFENGPLHDIDAILDSAGVSFHEGGSPHSLPGGNAISPSFDTAFRVTADNPAPHWGVANSQPPGQDWVSVLFGLDRGKTFEDVQTELLSGHLRIGLHVQGFPCGGSESFVNTPTIVSVPEPGTAMAMLTALAILGTYTRRQMMQ